MDKFYTTPETSSLFIKSITDILDLNYFDNIIEPSAGDGKLVDALKTAGYKCSAYDLLPEREDVTQMDFFDYSFPVGSNILIANPPFGKRSRLAIDFFNKAAESCEVICMIIPVTWEKYSVQRQLNEDWHLVFNERLPEKSFTKEGKPYKVRCVEQVWIKSSLNSGKYGGFL